MEGFSWQVVAFTRTLSIDLMGHQMYLDDKRDGKQREPQDEFGAQGQSDAVARGRNRLDRHSAYPIGHHRS